jgi:hypothetical protein
MNRCPERAIESAHGLALVFWFVFTAVNTQVLLAVVGFFSISPEKWWWWLISNILSIGGMVLITAILYRIVHYSMAIGPIRDLVKYTSLTSLPFWRRYNFNKRNKSVKDK